MKPAWAATISKRAFAEQRDQHEGRARPMRQADGLDEVSAKSPFIVCDSSLGGAMSSSR